MTVFVPIDRPVWAGSRWLVPALLALALAAVYGFAFGYPSFNPEHALFYSLNVGLTWTDILDRYLTRGTGFYRPTEFYGYYQAMSALVGWHGLYGFKLVSLLLLAGYGLALFRLGLVIWDGDRLSAGLAAGLAVIHPLNFINVYESVGFDLIYQILVLSCLIIQFGPALGGRRRWAWVAVAVVLFALALSAKEQALALPGVLVLHALLVRLPGPARAPRLVLIAATVVLGLAYLAFYLGGISYTAEGPYRTGFNQVQVWINLKSGVLWLAHLFTVANPVWPLMALQDTRSNFIFGVVVVAVVARYLVAVPGGGSAPGEGRRLALLAGMVAAFLVLPVYAGGRPWHYGLPLAAFALIEGRALAWVIRRPASPRLRLGLLVAVGVTAVTVSALDFARELTRRMDLFRINVEAVRHPPLPAVAPGATILYLAGSDVWPYGVGHLFQLAYLDPSIAELAVERLTPEIAQRWLVTPAAHFFVYDPKGLPAWRACDAPLRRYLQDGGDVTGGALPPCP